MRRVISVMFVLFLAVGVSSAGSAFSLQGAAGVAAQDAPGCEGQWLVQLTFEGRDAIEQAIAVFESDGHLMLHTPPVVPALPDMGEEPQFASDTVGSWAAGSGVHCTFDVVRLLAAEDGAALGAVNLRGGIVIDESGLGMDGDFTYDQSSGTGQTVASGAGTLTGTLIGE